MRQREEAGGKPEHGQEVLPTPTHCDWCGTKLRKGDAYPGMLRPAEVCPRRTCAQEQANHEDLLARIKEAAK